MPGRDLPDSYRREATSLSPAEAADSIASETADLLNKHALGGMSVSLVSSAMLALLLSRSIPMTDLFSWWMCMLSSLALRCLILFRWNQRRAYAEPKDAHAAIRNFILGISTTGFCWFVFPILYFGQLDLAGKALLATLLAGLAAGSAIVLSPKESLSIGFCAALLWPLSFLLLADGNPDSRAIGSLGLIFFVITSYSARLSHQSMLRAIRLGQANHVLLRGMEHVQQELLDSNQSLEARVQERTQALLREVHEKERFSGELARLARHDSLTGLYNRASLSERLEVALRNAKNRNGSVAVLFIDLDKFKEVNDVRGHFAGDQVLRTVTARLQARLGPHADLARWGGDEFVVVLPHLSGPECSECLAIAHALCECLDEPIDLEPEAVKIGATIGIALYPEHGQTQDELIRAADVAMYQGKQDRAASRIRMFDHELAADLSRRHRFAQALGRSVAENALSVLFQPIVLVPDGGCVAMEALVRWQHPELGPIPPSDFIPLAERSGDIVAIGRWVLVEACRNAASWPGSGEGVDPPAVSVNVSTAQVSAGCLIEDVVEALRISGLPAHRLHIELTESLFAGNQQLVGPTLQSLRAMGIRISLDDFGTGFSSLAYLRTLPVDTIKIDKSFVDDIEGDSRSIVKAIVSISKAMDFELIAEGVETDRQTSTLISMGVNCQQGYLLSRPLPASEVPEWLGRQPSAPGELHELHSLAQAVENGPRVQPDLRDFTRGEATPV